MTTSSTPATTTSPMAKQSSIEKEASLVHVTQQSTRNDDQAVKGGKAQDHQGRKRKAAGNGRMAQKKPRIDDTVYRSCPMVC